MSRHRRSTPARGWVVILAWVVGIGSAIVILLSPATMSSLVSQLPVGGPFSIPSAPTEPAEEPGISAGISATPTSEPAPPPPPPPHRSDPGAVISAFQDNVCTAAPGLARNARIVGCVLAEQFPGIMTIGPGPQQYALLLSVTDAGTGIEVSNCLTTRYQQWGLASVSWAGQNYYQPGGWQVAYGPPMPANQVRVMLFENTMPDPLALGCGK